MIGRPEQSVARRMATGLCLVLLAVTLAGCERGKSRVKPTACIGDQPAMPRIIDPAPPNCPN